MIKTVPYVQYLYGTVHGKLVASVKVRYGTIILVTDSV